MSDSRTRGEEREAEEAAEREEERQRITDARIERNNALIHGALSNLPGLAARENDHQPIEKYNLPPVGSLVQWEAGSYGPMRVTGGRQATSEDPAQVQVNGGPMWYPAASVRAWDEPEAAPAPQPPADAGATKADSAKVDLSLVPGKAMNAIAQALEYGAGKYGRAQYLQPPHLTEERLIAGVLRHLMAHLDGFHWDAESHLPHTYHAAAGLAMLHACHSEEDVGQRRTWAKGVNE